MSKVLKTDQTIQTLQQKKTKEIIYPDSDGKRMADNTEQFDLIVVVKLGIELIFADDPNVFVAGDLLWYPVEGDNKTRLAPDTMVAFGRPKGRRGSYMQWKENNIAPQVVFEVLSPGNRAKEMKKKLEFYEKYGVQEYYIIDPDRKKLKGYIRAGDQLSPIVQMNGWVSPKLKIKFEIKDKEIQLYRPDGKPFLDYLKMAKSIEEKELELEQEKIRTERQKARAEEGEARAEAEKLRAEAEATRAEEERLRAEAEKLRAEKLAEKLRLLGIDPDNL
ncbi:MAG: Uma2 family endonuclease [Blastocatellia bacterium]|nr:Uma2 family endonuclease [Blastocatellia bacterium]MBN8723890.1 Uma2 family endonuclease [Acidobacteriota bacterium]